MSRLPILRFEGLDESQRSLWDSIVASRGDSIVNAQGGLDGPFQIWLYAPAIGKAASELGAAVRFGSSLDRQVVELAIITTGANWKAEFEWWAHARLALASGIDASVIDDIGSNRIPRFERERERLVYEVAAQLGRTGTVKSGDLEECRELFGDRGTIELVTLCGYYTLVAFTLNAFGVALPKGADPQWAPDP